MKKHERPSQTKKSLKDKSWGYVSIIILAAFTYFFLGVGFHLGIISSVLITLVEIAIFVWAYRSSTPLFVICALVGITLAVALGISFSSPYVGSSPISVNLVLTPLWIVFISFLGMVLAAITYRSMKGKHKFEVILLVLFIILWLILGINVKYFEDWKLENYLTVPFVALIYFTHRWFKFSKISYTLIFIYTTLHIIGTHYTYAEVPFGFWIQHVLNLGRNHYDRLVHFAFGFLLAYPLRETLIRITNVKGFWGLYLPVDIVFAYSALYELIEWWIAVLFGGDLGIAYLGTQGDVWDAQKDMGFAVLGSIIAMLVTGIIRAYSQGKSYLHEFTSSLRIKSKTPLGEVALERFRNTKK